MHTKMIDLLLTTMTDPPRRFGRLLPRAVTQVILLESGSSVHFLGFLDCILRDLVTRARVSSKTGCSYLKESWTLHICNVKGTCSTGLR